MTSVAPPSPAAVPLSPKPWDLYTRFDRRRFLLILFLVSASNYIDRNIMSVLLEPIKAEFALSDTMLGVLSGVSFGVFYATLGIPVARWADRGDRKLVVTAALSIWSVMTGLCGLAGTFWQLAIARFGVGVGEAGAIPPGQSLLADYFPPEERARALGIFMSSAPVAYAIALAFGGFVAQTYGWRAAFLAVALTGAILAPLTHVVLKEPRRIQQFAVRPEDHEPLLVSIRVLARKRAYVNILAAIVVYFMMSYGALLFIVSYMMRFHGLSVARAGATYGAVAGIAALIGGPGGGVLSDRLAKRDPAWHPRVAALGMLATMVLYELMLGAPTLFAMLPLLLLSTVCVTAVISPMFSALHAVCGSQRRAMAVAVVFFFANLIGLGLGPVITGSISDKLAGYFGAANGLRYALMIMMSTLVLGSWLMLQAASCLKADVEN